MERFGLVGLPNAGKSSLYNALTGGGLGPPCKGGKNLAEPGQRLGHGPVGNPAREAGDDVAAKPACGVDQPLPVPHGLRARERVAVDADPAHARPRREVRRIECVDHPSHRLREPLQRIVADGPAEGDLERLEAVRQELRDHLGRAVMRRNERADADVVVAVHATSL
ncbi:MAG: GTPase, partial [Actinomycetota bacterium]